MSFPKGVREEALVRSRRACCVCHRHCGLGLEVHHIQPESDGGADTIDNAIVLCFECHSEAGHYNPNHPKGSKYSPNELRRHRDEWWRYCKDYAPGERPTGYEEGPSSARRPRTVHRKTVGVIWSNWANYPEVVEEVEFEGELLAEAEEYDGESHSYELFRVGGHHYLVYHSRTKLGDWCMAHLHGAGTDSELEAPLTLTQLLEQFPLVARRAGLVRKRRL